jgi:hypothetical protein
MPGDTEPGFLRGLKVIGEDGGILADASQAAVGLSDGVRFLDSLVEPERLLVRAAGFGAFGPRYGDIPQTPNRVGFAQHVAHLPDSWAPNSCDTSSK